MIHLVRMGNSLEAARKAFSHVKIEMTPGVVEVSVTDPRGHSGKGHVKLIEPEKWQVAVEIGMLLATEIYAGDKSTHEYAFQCVVCKMFFDSTVKHSHATG